MGHSIPSNRCGYSHDVSRFPDVGSSCCWRPVWGDTDRCVWHVDAAKKPVDALALHDPVPGERLEGAIVRESGIAGTVGFSGCVLVDADFAQADVTKTDFADADLREATFRDANARGATFTRANLEDAALRGVDLRDARLDQAKFDEVDFTDSRINRATTFGDRSVYERQLAQTADPEKRRDLFESATWTYRTLQRLAHQNARRGQTYEYVWREKDLRRRFAWNAGYYPFALKAEASRWFMGYGLSPRRVLGTSLSLILVCALLYPLTGGIQEIDAGRAITYTIDEPTDAPRWWVAGVLFKSLYFSIITFATVGYGDLQPVGSWARALASVESLLGGLLMALLVVVLARRVTRFQ